MHDNSTTETTSVLASLRGLLPNRRLMLSEALQRAELQADRLLHLRQITNLPVPVEIVTDLPRITIDYDSDLPRHAASGSSDWDSKRRAWVICVNPDEPGTRQRFTIIHEYKHIIDHYHPGLGGYLPTSLYGLTPVEYVAEYFAGCVLMPKVQLRAAFYDGIQRPSNLAELFDVSERAIEVRLSQLGLTEPRDDATRPAPRYRLQPRTRRYYRPRSLNWALATEEVAA
jgi:Zn-dependent peptidase ImmA (M78 family)